MTDELMQIEIENENEVSNSFGHNSFSSSIFKKQISITRNVIYRYGNTDEDLQAKFQSDTICEFLSYAIGCMVGRYSLDRKGLIYAHTGNKGFTEFVREGTYKTFPADDDGIIPLTDQEWFKDDATNRFREFVQVVWGEEHLQENLDFVAESLCLNAIKPKKSELALETIRRYLSTQFYKDHLKTYKNALFIGCLAQVNRRLLSVWFTCIVTTRVRFLVCVLSMSRRYSANTMLMQSSLRSKLKRPTRPVKQTASRKS